MATIPTSIKSGINSLYDQQKKNQLAELKASQQKAVGQVNQQKTETKQQYYDKSNQADVVNFQNRQALREMMAASGNLNGGENISGQVGLQAARQNVLGGLNREQQNIINALNQRITDINDPLREQQLIAQIETERNRSLLEALERAYSRSSSGGSTGGGGSSYKSTSKNTSNSNLSSQYAQYQKEKTKQPKTGVDKYYEEAEKVYTPNAPYRTDLAGNRYLQPVAPANNVALDPYDQLRILRGY
jgi:hypothetical protein